MPGEGRGLSSRPTQDAVRDREIGQPSSLSDWSLAERRTGRNATLDCPIWREGAAVRHLTEHLCNLRHQIFNFGFPIFKQVDPLTRSELVAKRGIRRHIFHSDRNHKNMLLTG